MIAVPKSGRPRPPETLDEAVDIVFARMSKEDREVVRKMEREGLSDLHFSLGMDIRNVVVYPGGEKLRKALSKQKYGEIMEGSNGSFYPGLHPDSVSSVIIEALWERLRKNEDA